MEKKLNRSGFPRILKIFLVKMKLTLTLMLFCLVSFGASIYSQNTRFSIMYNGNDIIGLFKQIEEKSEFYFFYQKEDLKDVNTVSVDVKDATVMEILDKVLSGSSLDYKIIDRYIIVRKSGSDIGRGEGERQQPFVNGKVIDSNGSPLPGVSVVVKGTSTGTITDAQGKYTLTGIPQNATLLFSFVGMQTQEVIVGSQSNIDVTMEEDVIGIEEVVAVGYGTIKKRDLTGTISSISTEKTMDIPNTNVLQVLQGNVAGLNVTTPDQAGESPSFGIRGINSLSASNTPLIVVDGIIYHGSLNDFHTNDIERIDVLKDASSTAVYGSRTSNGVIIITTKLGTASKPVFNFNTYYGLTNPVYMIPVLDGPKYIQKILDFRKATGLEADPAKIETYLTATEAENYRNGKTVDWMNDVITRTGETQSYNLNVSGRSDRTRYFLSGTYYKQEGIVVDDDYDRITAKANFDMDITDWYTFGLRTSFSSSDYSGIPASRNYGISPYGSYWEDEEAGKIAYFPFEETYGTGIHPLVATFRNNTDIQTSLLGLVSSEMEIPFVKGLKWTLNYSVNKRDIKQKNFYTNTLPGLGITNNGLAQKEISDYLDWTFDNIINYNRTFGEIHSVNATFLYSREYRNYEYTLAQANNFFNQALGYDNLGMGTIQETASNFEDENSVSYMGRLNYICNNRYLLTATIRKDGFSGFSLDNKYATFPSVALAWTVSEEAFLEDVSWLNLLKIRLSFGESGNQALGRYRTLARLANEQYIFGDGGTTVSTVYTSSMANNELSWETTTTKNIGLDFGLFKNRLNGNIDIYSSKTFDVLLQRNIPLMTGYNTVWTNIGEVHNHGVEVALNSVNIKRKDLKWESSATFSLNRNRIESLYGADLDGDGKEDDDMASSWFIGQPLGVIFDYKIDGIYQTDDIDIPTGYKPGDFRVVDVSGDGKIDEKDRTILGSTLPNYTFSISNTVEYKNFSLYFLINSIQGGGKGNYYIGDNVDSYSVNTFRDFVTWTERFSFPDLPYWTPERPSSEYPRINYVPPRFHRYVKDRSFVRLQDVNLSYTVSKEVLDKTFLAGLGLRLYISGKNLYTWTKWTGYDPENATSIRDYPMLRTYTLGVDLNF